MKPPRKHAPPCPPIVPELVYPWRRLADWGFGARGVAALVKAGMPVLKIGKMKFFRGDALISVMMADNRVADSQLEATP